MEKWKLILLGGYAGSGKDTFADYLVNKYNFKKLSFGEEMKIQCSKQHKIPIEYFYEREKKDSVYKDTGKTPRDILIQYAAEKRSIDPDYFTQKTVEMIDPIDDINYVISDCRFRREIDFVKKFFDFDVLSIWIHRDQVKTVVDNSTLKKEECDVCVDNSKEFFDGNDIERQILVSMSEE